MQPSNPSSLPQVSLDLNAHVQSVLGRNVTVFMKEGLSMFEQLAEEHDEAMDKLRAALPPEYRAYVDLADHYTEEKGGRIRRAMLQRGNDCIRANRDELAKYSVTLGGPPPTI